MKVYAINATVQQHITNRISIDTNAETATNRIKQSYDFCNNLETDAAYDLDGGLVFTNGHHCISYEIHRGPEPDSVLILTSRCSVENLTVEKSNQWVFKGIHEARKEARKILNK